MAPDLSDQERALLSRCPLFLGVEDALLRSLPALPGVTVEPFAGRGGALRPRPVPGRAWA